MILLEVVDAERRKVASDTPPDAGPTRRQADSSPAAASSSAEPQLPDYDTSQAQANKLTDQDEEVDLDSEKKLAKWKERRMTKWIIWALVIYVILSVAIAVPLFVVLRNNAKANAEENNQNYMNGNPNIPPLPPSSKSLPPDITNLPSEFGTSLQCNNWSFSASDNTYSLQYNLPVNETIYIRSNFTEQEGQEQSPMTGTFTVGVSQDSSQSEALVSVTMNNIGDAAVKAANVCTVRTDTGWGLAIYVPNNGIVDEYTFNVDLSLPIPDGGMILEGLATYLPSFNQTFNSLDLYAGLPSFIASGSGASISVASVHARSILVKTAAAEISGNFNATDTCFLETVLAPITANVSLYNEGNGCPPTQLEVETGHSDITLDVTLYGYANATEYYPPFFLTGATTFSGNVQASYRHDPNLQASALFVRATSSVNPAGVFVDSTFAGTYDVHTSLAEAVVDTSDSLPDPAGLGRQRQYDDEFISSSRRYGWTNWGPRPNDGRRQGHIEVTNSLGEAILQLTDAPDPTVLNGSSTSSGGSSGSDSDDDDDDDDSMDRFRPRHR